MDDTVMIDRMVDDARKAGKQEGRQEVVDWLQQGCACFSPTEEGDYLIQGWREQLEEWGIVAKV